MQKTKAVSVVLVVGASSWNARRFLFKIYVFHKLCKMYIFTYAKLYVLHKYMFLHV